MGTPNDLPSKQYDGAIKIGCFEVILLLYCHAIDSSLTHTFNADYYVYTVPFMWCGA